MYTLRVERRGGGYTSDNYICNLSTDPDKAEEKAREYYDDQAVVPPIRKFSKFINMDQKELFAQWKTGPMKPITKYGGLPKPTGCV